MRPTALKPALSVAMAALALPVAVAALALSVAVAACVACELPDRSRHTRTETRALELKPGGQLRASTFNGRIVVEGWERDEVSVVAEIRERREGDVRFSAEARDGLVEIVAEQEGRSKYAISLGGLNGASLTLRVPAKTAATVTSSNGRVEVRRVDGDVDATTSNASIAAEDIGGDARLATSNGGVMASSVKGGLVARTSNARMEAKDILGNADLRTSNGRIEARNVKGRADAVTSNGSITAENVEGDLMGSTSNGGLDVRRAFGAIDLSTSNGSIKAADLDGKGRGIRLATSNGGIDVTLGRAEGMLEATTNNSERSVSIEIPNVQPSKEGPTTKAKIGNGGQPITLKTTNGKIVVR